MRRRRSSSRSGRSNTVVSAVATTTATAALLSGAVFVAPAAQAAQPAAQVNQSAPRAVAPLADPTVSARGAYLVDDATGSRIYGKAPNTRRPIASTTKLMTVHVVLREKDLNLDRKVTVKQAYRDYVTRTGSSTADLKTGDRVTVRQLLYAALLPSGGDAAYALADTFGTGTTNSARTKSFIGKMNKRAAALGLENTRFDSFDGNSNTGNNYSTPKDLAKLARNALKNKTLRTVVGTQKTVRKATTSNGGTRTYTWYNTNRLLGSYRGATGVKTGTTTAAGPCLVFAGTRDGRTVIGVVLNAKDRYPDATKLLDHGFGVKSSTTVRLRQLPADAQRD
ncbi:D-alanyl-D-alanine carboxypeptidase [Streptomyces durbertensis]|uniref:D-alanyl-D-alanine carboxypeptidase n=1 Tax=Streptomyces durbertensis TaxID=2448886 RepID=A0ABR6EMM9_9ACTN|nr:serine hydrolase [Streptomyces durbertensis]MBB1246609.1 D-alanyl-D-alanine carboxypeptidase [Streptomyces durbertensis]